MICFITRWFISASQTDEKEPSRFVLRHISHCRACNQYFQANEHLAESLRSQAKAGLHLAAIDDASRQTPQAGRLWSKALRAAAIVAFAAAIAIVAQIQLDSPSQEQLQNLNKNAAFVADAPVIQYAMIAKAAGNFTDKSSGLETFVKQTFMLVYDNLKIITEAPEKLE